MPGYSEGRRRAFLRRRKSTEAWESKTDKELRDIYWKLRMQHDRSPQFMALCDFLQRTNKLEDVLK